MQLEPCPHCQRHVRITEAACPFCAASLADLSAPARLAPAARLGRAALFAFGMTASACGDNIVAIPVDSAIDVAPADATPFDDGGGVPIYAAAPTPDAGPKRG